MRCGRCAVVGLLIAVGATFRSGIEAGQRAMRIGVQLPLSGDRAADPRPGGRVLSFRRELDDSVVVQSPNRISNPTKFRARFSVEGILSA